MRQLFTVRPAEEHNEAGILLFYGWLKKRYPELLPSGPGAAVSAPEDGSEGTVQVSIRDYSHNVHSSANPLILREALVPDDIKKELADLERAEKELRGMKQELEKRETEIKRKLLAGATVEPGAFYAELRLLPARDPNSENPDDYDLIVSVVP